MTLKSAYLSSQCTDGSIASHTVIREPDDRTAYLHLLDHNGTINNLVRPLSAFAQHHIITSFDGRDIGVEDRLCECNLQGNTIVVLHATGSRMPFYAELDSILCSFGAIFVFLHVGPNHFLAKQRHIELNRIRELTLKGRIKVLTPSREVSHLFQEVGIPSQSIQLGVEATKYPSTGKRNFITTVCTSSDPVYQKVKGIDRFIKVVTAAGLAKQAIILGHDGHLSDGITRRRVSHDDFLSLLSQSCVYVQLSRTESYNLSAVEAKRLKVPVIVSNIEGHKDNVKYGFRVRSLPEAQHLLERIYYVQNDQEVQDRVDRNYRDSMVRETLEQFHCSLTAATRPIPKKTGV